MGKMLFSGIISVAKAARNNFCTPSMGSANIQHGKNRCMQKLRSMIVVAAGGGLVFSALGFYKGNEKLYTNVFKPLVHKLNPETAHRLAVLMAKYGLFPQRNIYNEDILKTIVWGKEFPNAIGLAAGFDKHGEAVDGLFKMGFGFVEVGSITPKPQPGNPKPRIFRLIEDKAVINRYGFNSDGHEVVRNRLKSRKHSKAGIMCVNLGKNKESPSANQDYVEGIENFAQLADFLVINISSPNTPGLRDMQGKKELGELISAVLDARDKLQLSKKVPVLVKIAPDLTHKDFQDIAEVIVAKKIDGIVISNTTISRSDSLISPHKHEVGGLSGAPLRDMSTAAIRTMYVLTKGNVPIIGVGGIASGNDAYEKIRAGASLIELYTAMVYGGPPVIARIKEELIMLLRNDGFSSISEAVGADHKPN